MGQLKRRDGCHGLVSDCIDGSPLGVDGVLCGCNNASLIPSHPFTQQLLCSQEQRFRAQRNSLSLLPPTPPLLSLSVCQPPQLLCISNCRCPKNVSGQIAT